jgi:hypothetical protein
LLEAVPFVDFFVFFIPSRIQIPTSPLSLRLAALSAQRTYEFVSGASSWLLSYLFEGNLVSSAGFLLMSGRLYSEWLGHGRPFVFVKGFAGYFFD